MAEEGQFSRALSTSRSYIDSVCHPFVGPKIPEPDFKYNPALVKEIERLHEKPASLYRRLLGKRVVTDANQGVFEGVSMCWMAEVYHRGVLDPMSKLYARGAVITHQDVPIGHVKWEMQQSFMPWHNLVGDDGSLVAAFGGFYGVPKSWEAKSLKKGSASNKEWGRVDVSSVALNPLRLSEEYFGAPSTGLSLRELVRKERARYTL